MSAAGAKFARPSWAKGLCDRCGFTYPLNELKAEIYDARPNGLLVCPDCFDVDHPQLQSGRRRFSDPIDLKNPRPDIDRPSSTAFYGWDPVGNPTSSLITCTLGTVTVSV